MLRIERLKARLQGKTTVSAAVTTTTVLLSLCALTIVVASAKTAYAENGSATASTDITVNLVDTLAIRTLNRNASAEIASLNLELTPSPSGKFVKDTSIVDVSTSNATGYVLYMTSRYKDLATSTVESPVYTTDMLNIDPSSVDANGYGTALASDYTIPTISTSITEATFSAASSAYRDRWGYSLNAKSIENASGTDSSAAVIGDVADTSAITYSPVPLYGTSDIIRDDVSSAVDYSYTPVTVGVNVDTNIAAGTYQNNLYFTAVGNTLPVDYKVYFNANTTDTTEDIPATQTASVVASSHTFTLPDNIASKPNMVIREWNTAADGSGTAYQPGDEFEITADSSLIEPGARTLYAIWTDDFWHITYMQDMYPTVCKQLYTPSNAIGTNARAIVLSGETSSVSGAGSTIAVTDMAGYKSAASGNNTPNVAQRSLYDIRDSKSYIVRKLADSNCWMTSNLRLELSTSKAVAVVVNETGELAPATPASATQQGAIDSNGMWTPVGSGGTSNASTSMNGNTKYASNYDSWYYSWYAATAGSGTSSMVTSNGDAPYSICPKGWRLPTNYVNSTYSDGGAPKSYSLVTKAYLGITESTHTDVGYKTMEAFPLSVPRAGYAESGSYNVGAAGYYWSSTAHSSATYAYHLYFSTTYVSPQGSNGKYLGFNARCVSL